MGFTHKKKKKEPKSPLIVAQSQPPAPPTAMDVDPRPAPPAPLPSLSQTCRSSILSWSGWQTRISKPCRTRSYASMSWPSGTSIRASGSGMPRTPHTLRIRRSAQPQPPCCSQRPCQPSQPSTSPFFFKTHVVRKKPTQENKSVNKCSARGTQQGKTAPKGHGKDMKFTKMGKGAESTTDGAIVI